MPRGPDSSPPKRHSTRPPAKPRHPAKRSSRRRSSAPRAATPHVATARPLAHPVAAGDPWAGTAMHPFVGDAPLELGEAGLGGVVLELLGDGSITLRVALLAWQREQDRALNRAWRRPGGLLRVGGA